jgi:DNA repair protein RecO (recombination protein O)
VSVGSNSRKPNTFSSKAILISKEVFGEADLYCVFLTERWGVISALAKSAKKSKRRYVGGLDLFCHDEIFIKGDPKERPYLIELSVLNSFTRIRDDLDKVLLAGRLTQWVKKLTLDTATPIPLVYRLLGQTLALIEQESDDTRLELLGLLFKLKLLGALGLKPRVESCVHCSGPVEEESFFDLDAGGVVCIPCSRKSPVHSYVRIDQSERRFIDRADDFKLTLWKQLTFPRGKAGHLSRLMNQFASYHVNVSLPI